jgi:hypothetical protein
VNGEHSNAPTPVTTDPSVQLAHERLSKAAAGGFTTGLIERWGPSEANCAAAAMERANYFREENDRLRAALEPFARGAAHAEQCLARLGPPADAMEWRDLYMWHAPRVLCINDFKNAAKELAK